MQIQTLIHRLEEGGGLRYLKYWLVGLVLVGLFVSYNFRGFRNMSNPEAMDAAQLARNIAEGKGYHTEVIRPFSMYLLKHAYDEKNGPAPLGDMTDRMHIRSPHPDLANPPVYPFVLASLMKIFKGLRYQPAGTATLDIGSKHINAWNHGGSFWIYPPDFWISLFNQCIFLGMVVMVFFLARRLFDSITAWTSAGLFFGTDLFWQFSMSGLSTMLLMLIFLSLAWNIMKIEQEGRKPAPNAVRINLMAMGIGALIGIGCLTRYSFAWLIIPTLVFTVLFLGRSRVMVCLITVVTFCVVISPWVARNYHLSRTFFGTAGYSVYENTTYFPENRLGRSLNPDLTRVHYDQVFFKTLANVRGMIQDEMVRLGGSWISAFFLAGLLIHFRNPSITRLRYFVLLCIPILMTVQAAGRTQLTDDRPIINSENLMVLVGPLIIIYGVSFFYILLDQIKLPLVQLKYLVIALFCFFICLPSVLSLVSPRVTAYAFPPYYPPVIQKTADWMRPDELMMSDIPWAVAWYGNHECLWLTLNAQSDFFSISDYQRPIKAIYLTPVTMDSRFLTQWVRASEYSWGSFAIESLLKGGVPPAFPLKKAPTGFLPEQLFLTDVDRWTHPIAGTAASN